MRYLWIFVIFFSGCVPIPKERFGSHILPSVSLDRTIEEGVTSGVIVSGDLRCSNWWEMFGDSQLNDLIEKGLLQNPSLQEAFAKVIASLEEAKVQRSFLFPTVDYYTNVNWQHLAKYGFFRAFAPTIPANVTETTLGLDFSYEFDFWGKWRQLYQGALGRAFAQEAERSQTEILISTSIAAAYFRLQTDLQEWQILEEQQEVLQSLLSLRKQREKNAIDSIDQILAVEKVLFTLQKQINVTSQNIRIDKHLLLSLIGEGPEDDSFDLKNLFVPPQIPIPMSVASDLLAFRPDLMAQIWKVEAATQEVGAAKTDFYPNIDLVGLGGLDTVFIRKLFTAGSLASSVTPALHLPIFTAGRIRANLETKRAMLEQEIAHYNWLLLNAAKEVADQIVTLKTANENLNVQLSLVQNRKEVQDWVKNRYKHAISNSLELLDATWDLLQEQLSEKEAQYDLYLASILLIKALGGGWNG